MYGNSGDGKGGSKKSDRLLSHIQDPTPLQLKSSSTEARKAKLVEEILDTFVAGLPSNYASKVRGPFYIHLFRSFAETLADLQMEMELISDESTDFGLIRSDFLYQLLGRLVFPAAMTPTGDAPIVDGDVSLRDFLQEMVNFLLEGARKAPISEAVGYLADTPVEIIVKSEHQGETSAWGLEDQFEFEVNMIAFKSTHKDHDHWHRIRVDSKGNGETKGTYFNSSDRMEVHVHEVKNFRVQFYKDGAGVSHNHKGHQAFPHDPFTLQYNVKLILAALKPAHTLYEYRHLFLDGFGQLFEDDVHLEHESWRYEDLRKNWRGSKFLKGAGEIGSTDRSLLIDPDQDFSRVPPYAKVYILDGDNEGTYQALEALPLPVLTDSVGRPYTTSPSGLSGVATVDNGEIADSDQDFAVLVSGETLTFTEGPNTGTYRVAYLLGSNGGPIGTTKGGLTTRIRLAHSLLRVRPRMTHVVNEQSYQVGLDRLGESEPVFVVEEDCVSQFLL